MALTTVRSQIRSILRKLGVRSQLAAVAQANRAGWRPRSGRARWWQLEHDPDTGLTALCAVGVSAPSVDRSHQRCPLRRLVSAPRPVVLDRQGLATALISTVSVTPECASPAVKGDTVVAIGTGSGTLAAGGTFTFAFCTVLALRDELIARVESYIVPLRPTGG